VTGTLCAKHPSGRSGKRCRSPYSRITQGHIAQRESVGGIAMLHKTNVCEDRTSQKRSAVPKASTTSLSIYPILFGK